MTSIRMPALDGALAGDRELALREVAQAAVDELGRPARRAERQVVRVDCEHRQAAGDGVEGDTGAGDAEADHHDVHLVGDAVEAGDDASGRLHQGSSARATARAYSASRSSSPIRSSVIVIAEKTNPWPRGSATAP